MLLDTKYEKQTQFRPRVLKCHDNNLCITIIINDSVHCVHTGESTCPRLKAAFYTAL